MAEAVDHGGGQQHADDAQNRHHCEDQELGGLRLAELCGDLVDLASLWHTEEQMKRVRYMFLLLFVSEVSGSLCSSTGGVWYSHRQDKSFDSSTMLEMSVLVMYKLQGFRTTYLKVCTLSFQPKTTKGDFIDQSDKRN